MDFDQIVARFSTREIPNCPGRFYIDGARELGVESLAGDGADVRRYKVAGARDPVVVATIEGGGIISYEKSDGHLHTLCTPAGFRRKLAALGIEYPG